MKKKFKEQDILYIIYSPNIGIHLCGYKVEIIKVNLKKGLLYSFRVFILEEFEYRNGFRVFKQGSLTRRKQTFYFNGFNKYYKGYTTLKSFKIGMQNCIENHIKIIQSEQKEIDKFT